VRVVVRKSGRREEKKSFYLFILVYDCNCMGLKGWIGLGLV
jgi:hypothetical protein